MKFLYELGIPKLVFYTEFKYFMCAIALHFDLLDRCISKSTTSQTLKNISNDELGYKIVIFSFHKSLVKHLKNIFLKF